jgi:hypothetical protein
MDTIDEQFQNALHREARARTADLELPEPEPLVPDAPAPRLQELVNEYGSGPCGRALAAWQARMMGESIIQVATDLGLSIDAAKVLIREVHEAVSEDLKENLDLNRSLDLARIDALIAAHFPRAKAGKIKSAQLVLRCLERRTKLIGLEPLPAPSRGNSQSVLIWIQEKLPGINAIVNELPTELPPPAP